MNGKAIALGLLVVIAAATLMWKPGGESGAALAGVFIGSLLGFVFSEYSQSKREAVRNRGVRAALRQEFEQNLSSLFIHWEHSKTAPDHVHEQLTSRQSRFVLGLFPPWSRTMWLSQSPYFADALTEPELINAMRLQQEREVLQTVLDRITTSLREIPEIQRINEGLWQEIEATVCRLLDAGNPIDD